jgi:pimeloyl-ACP methyl ester carboxylesterase
MSKGAAVVPRGSFSVALLSIALSGCGAVATAPPTGTASPTPILNPMANPSIEGSFAVADDGREVALVCWGVGAPTVILETGGTNIDEWSNEGGVRQLAERGRVCTYDRAGTGASDPAPNEKRDADDVNADLSALLKAASVEGPYLLLGRSFGGMIVTYYAQEMPDGVLGVVVFDSPAPSADFTEESEPELVWDNPGNTEHLDVVGGFENRFAKEPPHIDVPLLLITPADGESSPKDQRFWLQVSGDSEQLTPPCECYSEQVIEFIAGLE